MNTNKVTVLTPNGRRQNIKITPGTIILQILEEVCQKYGFSSEEYGLRHHKTTLDLTQMFRFSGLPNNCLLEMVEAKKKRQESDILICLQLEDGSRCQGSFKPSDNIATVLHNLCPEKAKPELHPVVIYMRKEIFGESLSESTLRSLGITSGRAIIRMVNKNPEQLRTQANVYVPIVKATVKEEAEPKISIAKDTVEQKKAFSVNIVEAVKQSKQEDVANISEDNKKPTIQSEPEEMQIDTKTKHEWPEGEKGNCMRDSNMTIEDNVSELEEKGMLEKEEPIFELGERNAILFSLESTGKIEDDIPDSFFDLTVHDMQLILRDLKKQASGDEDTPLLTTKLREIEENNKMLNKLAQYKIVVIRIQFPDRLVLQGTFTPVEKVQDVYEFIKNFLKDSNLDFHLFTIPPKRILPIDKTLLEVDCVPTAVLHFGVEDNLVTTDDSFLKSELQTKISSAKGAILAASKSRGMAKKEMQWHDIGGASGHNVGTSQGAIPKQPKVDAFKQSTASAGTSGPVPKWFKPTGK